MRRKFNYSTCYTQAGYKLLAILHKSGVTKLKGDCPEVSHIIHVKQSINSDTADENVSIKIFVSGRKSLPHVNISKLVRILE